MDDFLKDNLKEGDSFVITARKFDDASDVYFGHLTSSIILGIDTNGNFDFNCIGVNTTMEMADLCMNSMKVLLQLHKMLKEIAIKDSTNTNLNVVDNVLAISVVKYADAVIEKLKAFEDDNV